MRAVLCNGFDGIKALSVGEAAEPHPGGDEVLIDVHAASVSYMDYLIPSAMEVPDLEIGHEETPSPFTVHGIKGGGERIRATLAAFYIRTVNELAVLQNSGGRTVAQNIGETNRRGMELEIDATLMGGFSGRLAYTYIRAVVGQSYATCIAAPCNPLANPGGPPPANYKTVNAGDHLPAVPMNTLYAALTWSYAPLGFSTTLETLGRARIYADDRNSAAAAGFWVANLRGGFEQETRHWRVSEFARLDNLANRAYVGSVIVNEGNTRYYEPSPRRSMTVGVQANLRF